jgi:4-amino-4-deoxy-L-arabinose transferase-like glycosyltransferase
LEQVSKKKESVAIIFLILILGSHLFFLTTPLTGDARWGFVPGALKIEANNFNPLYDDMRLEGGHPPFFFELLAISYKVFGYSLLISHLIIILFSFLGVYFTYLLGSLLFNKKIGFLSGILLSFIPTYFSLTNRIEMEIPLLALTVMAIYFALKKNYLLYLISGVFLTMMKEEGHFAILSILIYLFIKEVRSKASKRNIFKKLIKYAIPLFPFYIWELIHYVYRGILFRELSYNPDFYFSFVPTTIINNLVTQLKMIFIYQFKFILLFFIMYVIIKNIYLDHRKKNAIKEFLNKNLHILPLVFNFLIYLIFYSILTPIIIRRFIFAYPLFCIIAVKSIDSVFKKKSKYVIMIIIIIFILQLFTYAPYEDGTYTTNLGYLEVVDANKQGIAYVYNNFPEKRVLFGWETAWGLYPEAGYLTKSSNEYLKESIEKVRVHNLDIDAHSMGWEIYDAKSKLKSFGKQNVLNIVTIPENISKLNNEDFDLVFYAQAPGRIPEIINNTKKYDLTLIKKLGKCNGHVAKCVEIYKNNK